MSNSLQLPSKAVLIRNLQKELLMRCLHDIQSPLSGASGYLELMQICLNGDKDLFKIARYRNKIQEGLEELEEILNQMSYIFKGEIIGDDLYLIEFDLNWLLSDICENITALAAKKEHIISFSRNKSQNIHVVSDMLVLKLFLYNLIINVLKVTEKEEMIDISLNLNNDFVQLFIRINEIVRPLEEVIHPFVENESLPAPAVEESNYRYGAQAIKLLNGSVQIKRHGDNGAEILFLLPQKYSHSS